MSSETWQERQSRLFGARNLATLSRSKVAILGTGLLGGAMGFHLGPLQTLQLLIDPDVVDQANIANQDFPADRVGDPKVVVRSDQLKARSPGARTSWLQSRLEDVGLGAFARMNLLVTGLDSRISRLRVAEISQLLGVPWLDMACNGSGDRLQGSVTLWDPRIEGAPCAACRYDAEELEQVRREDRGPGCPSWGKPEAPDTPPTLMASPFGGVIAGFAATWAVRSLLEQAHEIANTQLQIFGDDTPRIRQISLERSKACPLHHEALGKLEFLEGGTIGDLFERATSDLGAEPDSLRFHHRRFVPELYCATEGVSWEFARLAESIHRKELECGCRVGAQRVPTALEGQLSRKDVERFGERQWSQIGLPRKDIITATAGDRAAHYVVGGRLKGPRS